MATQSDLDKMRKKLSDLDAKLKSMRGNSPQRNPNFDSAMANQNFKNSMAEQRARMDAERRTSERPFKLQIPRPPTYRPSPDFKLQIPRPPTSQPSPGPMINPETLNKARDEYVKQNPGEVNRRVTQDMIGSRYLGPIGRSMSGFDKWFETNYINNPNSSLTAQERASIIPERRITADEAGRMQGPQRDPNTGMTFQEMMARQNQPLPPEQAPFTPRPQLPQEVRDAIEGRNAAQNQFTQGRLMGAPVNQSPQPGSALYQDLANQQMQKYQNSLQQSQQGTFESQYQNLANQQMQNYNNLLQQGIQRSNTMNQDAATNFANLQAGAPTTQPTIPLPQLGGVTAQPRNLPRPRQPKGFGSPIGRSAF